ncbi:hypothetical protein OC845_002722 [Tilletia horrida]|nr:hypothetical protein OC845_002722 [Tilletia horrida]
MAAALPCLVRATCRTASVSLATASQRSAITSTSWSAASFSRTLCAPSSSQLDHRRFYASSKSRRRNRDEDEDENEDDGDDVPVLNTRGKGAKGAKSKQPHGAKSKHGSHGTREARNADSGEGIATTTRNQSLPDEKFDLAHLSENMQRAVKRCRETVSSMVGMIGRPDPAILDSVRVQMPTGNEGNKGEPIEKTAVPLRDLATVGVRDGSLWITCYDPESVKLVERGIYLAELGLSPQVIQNEDEAVVKIPIPRPNAETRAKLAKDVARICENARVSIRAARHEGQKALSADQKNKIVGSEEARKEGKKLDEETKRFTSEVDKLLEEMKQKVEHAS